MFICGENMKLDKCSRCGNYITEESKLYTIIKEPDGIHWIACGYKCDTCGHIGEINELHDK